MYFLYSNNVIFFIIIYILINILKVYYLCIECTLFDKMNELYRLKFHTIITDDKTSFHHGRTRISQ